MTSRTIVGAIALLALIGIGIYLLAQIPWEFALGGIAALIGLWLAVGRSAPDAP
jgi:preprotein translocase subunit SecF